MCVCVCVCACVCVCTCAQWCLTLYNPLDGSLPGGLLCPWNFPGKNTRAGCHFPLQRIFWTQGSNSRLLHCRQILYHWATWEASPPYILLFLGEKKRPAGSFISPADNTPAEPGRFAGWELAGIRSWFISFPAPEYPGTWLESLRWASVPRGVWDRRSRSYNEVPLVLWKLASLGWDPGQTCAGLSVAKQVCPMLPAVCVPERANENESGSSNPIRNDLMNSPECILLESEFISIQDSDVCFWSTPLLFHLSWKIWECSNYVTNVTANALLHELFPRTVSVVNELLMWKTE